MLDPGCFGEEQCPQQLRIISDPSSRPKHKQEMYTPKEESPSATNKLPASLDNTSAKRSKNLERRSPQVKTARRAADALVDDLLFSTSVISKPSRTTSHHPPPPEGVSFSYLDLDALALVVHVDALPAGLLVAVVGEAHGGAEGRGEGAEGLLAGAEVHVGGVLGVVEGDAGVVHGVDGGGEGCGEGGGEEEVERRHCC